MAILLVPLVVAFLHYIFLLLVWKWSQRVSGPSKCPPWLPYLFPGLGHSFELLKNPLKLVKRLRDPCRLRIPTLNPYIVPGPKNICLVFKQSNKTSSSPAQTFIASRLFGMHKAAAEAFIKDNSGYSAKPIPGTDHIEPRNRICYRDHELLHSLLHGQSLSSLTKTFHKAVLQRFDSIPVTKGWMELPDLFKFLTTQVSPAAIEAFVGPALTEVIDPDFVRDFWEFDGWVPSMAKNAPKPWVSAGFRLRDKLLDSMEKWRCYLDRASHDIKAQCPDAILEKLKLRDTDGWDMRAVAASDLGLIWASNSNTISALFWLSFEIFRSPQLLSQIRKECQAAVLPGPNVHKGPIFELESLLDQAYLQASFAEVLRQRNHIFITRYTDRGALQIEKYLIPAKSTVVIASTISHMDENLWNSGTNGEHPLDTFWPGRFLQYQDNPLSGPLKSTRKSERMCRSKSQQSTKSNIQYSIKTQTHTPTDNEARHERDRLTRLPTPPQPQPYFTRKGLEGIYIPFGGGSQMCPGRYFAQAEIFLSVALLVTWFDVELCLPEAEVGVNMGSYGTGVSKPDRCVPCRIRRRAL